MFIDAADPNNYLEVSFAGKTAKLSIKGTMKRYVPGPNYCEDGGYVLGAQEPGWLLMNFETNPHMTPRNFSVVKAAGSISGAGIDELLGPIPNPSGIATAFGNSVCIAELMQNVPNLPPAAGGALNAQAPFFTAQLAGMERMSVPGNPPRTTVIFSAGSTPDTDGLTIYQPTGLGGKVVPDEIEDLRGSQCFVNLDNDDGDGYFDIEIPDRSVPN